MDGWMDGWMDGLMDSWNYRELATLLTLRDEFDLGANFFSPAVFGPVYLAFLDIFAVFLVRLLNMFTDKS